MHPHEPLRNEIRALLLLVAASPLSGCAPPATTTTTGSDASAATSLPGAVALRWSVSQGLWGTEVFEVMRGGNAHYSFEPVGGGPGAKSFDVTVTQAQLDDIAGAAGRWKLCDEMSSRLGVPDEGRPTLVLSLGDVRCSVTMWDGEWRERKGPREIAAKVVALHQR